MGFIDFVKATFSKGGIKISMTAPKDFRWGDETIPVTVTLTGHKTEARTIMPLGFVVEDEMAGSQADGDNSPTFGSRVRIHWQREGAIDLAPGQSVTLDVPISLTPAAEEHAATQTAQEEAIQDTTVGRFLGAASKLGVSFGSMTDPRDIRDYRVTVHALARGTKNPAKASRKIRQGGAFRVNRPRVGF